MRKLLESSSLGGRLVGALVVACCLLFCTTPVLAEETQPQQESSPEERAKVRVFEALDLMDAGSYGEARLMLELALGLNAKLDRAWYYLAQCNIELKNWDQALDALAKYEGAKLSEHERMQIVELRGTIEAGRSAEASSGEPAAADNQDTTSDAASSSPKAAPAGASRDEAARNTAATGASASARSSVPRPLGPIIMVIGGIVGGVGLGMMAYGWSAGQIAQNGGGGPETYTGNMETWQKGYAPYWGGLGIAIGGGVALAAGIPLTIAGAKAPAKVVISYQADAVQTSAGVYLMGRW